MSRSGPSAAKMTNVGASNSNVSISSDGLTVENKGEEMISVKCPVKVARGGKWYYETKLVSSNQVQVGWVTENWNGPVASGQGVGNDTQSWSYDGCRQRKLTGTTNTWYGEYLYNGDVIGTSLDLDEKKINFFRNGRDLGVAFDNLDISTGFRPACSLSRKQKVTFNFGATAWAYQPPNQELKGLHCFLSEKELEDLGKLFSKYKGLGISMSESGDTGDKIKGQGFLQYGKDLGVVEDTDIGLLILAWKLDAHDQWEFQKEEFMDGWTGYSCSTVEAMKKKLDEWRNEVSTKSDAFRQFYFFLFDYLKEERKTIIMTEEAVMVWTMLGFEKRWTLFKKWTEYMEKSKTASVSRDTWRQFYDFTIQHDKSVENYDVNGSWPVLMDGFVEFMTDGGGGNSDD